MALDGRQRVWRPGLAREHPLTSKSYLSLRATMRGAAYSTNSERTTGAAAWIGTRTPRCPSSSSAYTVRPSASAAQCSRPDSTIYIQPLPVVASQYSRPS